MSGLHALAEPVSGRRLLLSLGLWPLATGALLVGTLGVLAVADGRWTRSHLPDVAAIGLLEAYVSLILVLVLVFGGRRSLSVLGVRATNRSNLVLAGFVWAAALAAGGILTFALAPLMNPLFGAPRSNAIDVLKLSFDPLFVALVVPTVCLLAPAGEELLFRGAIYGWLRRRLPIPAAIALAGLAFALAHLAPPLLPVLFAFGIATAAVYEYTGSTLNSFAMHCAQNTLGVVSAYIVLSRGGGA